MYILVPPWTTKPDFTQREESLKKFLDIKTMSLKDDSMEIKIMIEGTGCLKNHENEQQGPLSKKSFFFRHPTVPGYQDN